MRKCIISLLAVTAFVYAPFAALAQKETYSKDVQDKIQQVEHNLSGWVQVQDSGKWVLQQRMAMYKLKGVSIAVIKNFKVEWAKAYGWADEESKIPVTTQTLFQAASISKSLNGVGVMKLVQDKKIDLYTDINQYLTTWKFPYDTFAHGKTISMANLLSHTAGLTVHGFGGYEAGDSIPAIPQILDGERPANSPKVRFQEVPGVRSEYSGGGITISQLVVMDVTHQPYDEYMWKNVLQPMGMLSSTYTQPPPAGKLSILATGYRGGGEPVKGKYHTYPEQAAAGLWTNPTDLAHYIIETALSYNGRSAKVLNQASTRTRLTPYIDKSAALGVFCTLHGDTVIFSHGGANEGFRSQYYGNTATGDGVVVMVNSDNGAILEEIVNSVATVYNWQNFYHPVIKKEITPPLDTLQLYTGKYLLNSDTIPFVIQQNKLVLLPPGEAPITAHFTTNTEFFVFETRLPLKFIIEGGKVTAFKLGEMVAKKIE